MIKNYFKTTLRSLIRNKLYTILNIAGLAFGINCFLLIGLYLFDELTFDRQHKNAGRIYRVIEHRTVNGESTMVGLCYSWDFGMRHRPGNSFISGNKSSNSEPCEIIKNGVKPLNPRLGGDF